MRVVCVACPVGCTVEVEIAEGSPTRVRGHGCPRGEAYAREEALHPRRVLTTSVRVVGGDLPLASVRTSTPIPRPLIPAAMALARALVVRAPVEVGQVVAPNILGTGADLVATRRVPPVDPPRAPPIMANASNGEKTKPSADRGTPPDDPGGAAAARRGAHGGARAEARRLPDDGPHRSRRSGGEG
ncbi:MAG: hypothetical protein Kow0097_04610 [Candidatus Bipolaricaulota bacterium]